MSQLSETLDRLYSDFLLRDILAKFVPGLLTLALALQLFAPRLLHSALRLAVAGPLVPLVALYGVSFMAGMLIQFVGMWLRLERVHVWDGVSLEQRMQASLTRSREFLRANSQQPALLRARERYAILKEMAGNYGVALLLAAVLLIVKALPWDGRLHTGLLIISVLLVVLSILLLRQNRFHADEQRFWESPGAPVSSDAASAARPATGRQRPSRRSRG